MNSRLVGPWAVVLLIALGGLAGCGGAPSARSDTPAAVDDRSGDYGVFAGTGTSTSKPVAGGALAQGAAAAGAWTGSPLDNPASPLYEKTIYFDYDVSAIEPAYFEALRAHATYLLGNPGTRLVIEGHCDERGSREYNIGLGERRAVAVRRFLEAEGVPARQLETVSYGEERPADFASTEAAWRKNRRAELIYP